MKTPQPQNPAEPAPLATIPSQPDLPLAVSFEIVRQGLRIRLGRSLVTLSGVALGIAFLMSTLAMRDCREAVAVEHNRRAETSRLLNVITAEAGPPQGQVLAIVQSGTLSDSETRLIHALLDRGVAQLRWSGAPPPLNETDPRITDSAKDSANTQPAAILLLGAAQPVSSPPNASTTQPIPTFTFHPLPPGAAGSHSGLISLQVAPDAEEQARAVVQAQQARIRSLWILVISVLVTVMGIANALLMSVTERFREIGTMKCLGARSSFIRRIFLLEAALLGLVGGVVGALLGILIPILAFGLAYGFGVLFASLSLAHLIAPFALAIGLGVILSVLAAAYPASLAARMAPALALRTEI